MTEAEVAELNRWLRKMGWADDVDPVYAGIDVGDIAPIPAEDSIPKASGGSAQCQNTTQT